MMFIFGAAFLIAGVYSYVIHSFANGFISVILIVFAVYAAIEASYYRYWRTLGFAVIAISLAIILII